MEGFGMGRRGSGTSYPAPDEGEASPPLASPADPASPMPDPASLKPVTIYTDGSCSGNPGPGGWGALLVYGDPPDQVTRELKGAEAETTNNRMELQAAAEALEALREPCRVTLHSDSAYLINAFKQRWMDGWIKRGWKTANKTPVLNQDLWERLIAQDARHEVAWTKVKGHAGVELNEHVDGLAVGAMRTMQAELRG